MNNSGRMVFGVKAQDNSLPDAVQRPGYNDNQWHMITPPWVPEGMALYVDGVRVGSAHRHDRGQTYLGFWRLGGDNLGGWPDQPSATELRRQRRRDRDLPDAR